MADESLGSGKLGVRQRRLGRVDPPATRHPVPGYRDPPLMTGTAIHTAQMKLKSFVLLT